MLLVLFLTTFFSELYVTATLCLPRTVLYKGHDTRRTLIGTSHQPPLRIQRTLLPGQRHIGWSKRHHCISEHAMCVHNDVRLSGLSCLNFNQRQLLFHACVHDSRRSTVTVTTCNITESYALLAAVSDIGVIMSSQSHISSSSNNDNDPHVLLSNCIQLTRISCTKLLTRTKVYITAHVNMQGCTFLDFLTFH